MDVASAFGYVRTSLDSDSVELPDALLSIWMQEGVSRVKSVIVPSATLWTTWSLSVIAGQQAYLLSAFSPAIDVVSAVTGPHWMLQHQEHEALEHLYSWNQADSGGFWGPQYTGNSAFWSVYSVNSAPSLYLWPPPATTETYQVRGQRDLSTTDQFDVDLDIEYHPLVCEYMVARGHEMQSNVTVAAMKFNRFEQELQAKAQQNRRIELQGVVTIGGERYDSAFNNWSWPGRLRFPFE